MDSTHHEDDQPDDRTSDPAEDSQKESQAPLEKMRMTPSPENESANGDEDEDDMDIGAMAAKCDDVIFGQADDSNDSETPVAAEASPEKDALDDDDEDEIVRQRSNRYGLIDDEADEDEEPVGDKDKDSEHEKMPEANDDVENFIDDDEDTNPLPEQQPASAPKSPETMEQSQNKDTANDEDDGDDVFDIGALKAKYDKIIFGDEGDDDNTADSKEKAETKDDAAVDVQPKPQPVVQSAYFQPAFQPGSTPIHYEQRFMLWNETGIVRAYSNETEDTIDVEFHDVATHHSINMTNSHDYVMAALSPEALVLANCEADSEITSSRIFCMNFITWDESNKEWTVELPEDEFAEALGLGSGFIAVATSQRFIRLFTTGGTQLHMTSIAGPIVCLTAQENSLMAVYNSAPGTKYNPVLAAHVFKVNAKSAILPKQPLPNPVPVSLAPNSLLSWAGFTDEGTPCVVDSVGYVRLLRSDVMGNSWIPIVNLKEKLINKTDNNFVIGLSEITEQVRCIFCKGSRYPSVIPRPHVTFVAFEMPFCGRTASKGKLEEKHMRSKLANNILEKLMTEGYDVENQTQVNYKSMNESLLRLFAMAIGSNCEALALEISYLMPSGKSVESAVRYALQKRCTALAEKLRQVALEKDNEAAEQVEADPEIYQTSPRKSAVPVLDDEVEILRPKPVTRGKKPDPEYDVNDDSNDSESSNNVKKTGKRKRPEAESTGKVKSHKELGFDVYLEENFESIKNEDPDYDDSEIEDIARDRFLALPFGQRKEYQQKSEANQSKRSRSS